MGKRIESDVFNKCTFKKGYNYVIVYENHLIMEVHRKFDN